MCWRERGVHRLKYLTSKSYATMARCSLVAAISFVAMLARRGYRAPKETSNGFCADLALNNPNSGPRAPSVVSASP